MKKIVLALCFLFSAAASANPIDNKCSGFAIWGAPQVNTEGEDQYICKTGYAVNLNYKTKHMKYNLFQMTQMTNSI